MLGSYPTGGVIWTMIVFFAVFIYFVWVVMLMVDNFPRRDPSGWAKGLWFLFIIFFPILGPLAYTITRPHDAADSYHGEMYGTLDGRSSSSAEIGRLNDLRISGAINDSEFEQLKQQTISGA